MRLVYTVLLYLLTPLVVLRLLWKSHELPDYRRRIGERFGFGPQNNVGGPWDGSDQFFDGPITLAVHDWGGMIGLAYAAQRIDIVPRGPHDMPLEAVITEDGLTSFVEASA